MITVISELLIFSLTILNTQIPLSAHGYSIASALFQGFFPIKPT